MSDATRYRFMIPIGDWSGDGHGKCDWLDASAAKPIGAVRDAWFAAKEKLPDLAPDTFCNEYEARELPGHIIESLNNAGCPLPEDDDDWDAAAMAAIVAWFLNQGDPDLDVRPEPSFPSLTFYGFDEHKRHIDGIGYGLFS